MCYKYETIKAEFKAPGTKNNKAFLEKEKPYRILFYIAVPIV